MSTSPDYMNRMSEKLSEVMDDIGVNEKFVMERRKFHFLYEAFSTLCKPFTGYQTSSFIFGSQIEGSTTLDLNSDMDVLGIVEDVNLIQDMEEWKSRSRATVMMIQNENISPGYCYLQAIRSDIPSPFTVIKSVGNNVTDSEGRVLWNRNVLMSDTIVEHGPALTLHRIPGVRVTDLVRGYYCKSSPLQATPWLDKLSESKWPSEDDKTFCRNAGCFVVSACSKLSDMPKYELRISTSLHERCLMFSLNITQLRCYVLMKMIFKTHIHPNVEDVLSSFMCKNVLLYCVYNSSHESSQEWHTGNLLSYLQLCLFMLNERILQRNCPHLMIPGNNLLAGHMTESQRSQLLDIIGKLMEDKEELLYKIQFDGLGRRFVMKLTKMSFIDTRLSAIGIASLISHHINIQIFVAQKDHLTMILKKMYNTNLTVTEQNMSELLSNLKKTKDEGNSIQQTACDLIIPLVKSALGSVMASISKDAQTSISDEAITYLEAGRESDVLSGRLKLVSVLYSRGDVERVERELNICQQLCNTSVVISHTCCFPKIPPVFDNSEEVSKFKLAFCTRFLNNEISCVHHELRYEILKSYIEEDRKMRTEVDAMWMDLIAVDSVPYLYFLQYKTYGRLQRRTEQEEALLNLKRNIASQPDLNHKETTLNLIGQCMEQENLQAEAFQYYIRSLQHRERNNAARFLMCIQLFKLWKKYNV